MHRRLRGQLTLPLRSGVDLPVMNPESQTKSILLVVDDDRDVLEALRDVLQDSGFLVLTAANGREALDLLDTGARPDLAIVDLMMPVMDGWAFVSSLRQIE